MRDISGTEKQNKQSSSLGYAKLKNVTKKAIFSKISYISGYDITPRGSCNKVIWFS